MNISTTSTPATAYMLEITLDELQGNFNSMFQHIDAQTGEAYTRIIGDIYNTITINGEEFLAVYRTGESYLNGYFTSPSPKFELSKWQTTKALYVINNTDLQNGESVGETLKFLKENGYGFISTPEHLNQIKEVLIKNAIDAQKSADTLWHDDYDPDYDPDYDLDYFRNR